MTTLRGIPRDPDSCTRAAERFRAIVARADASVAVEDRSLRTARHTYEGMRTMAQEKNAARMREWAARWRAKKRGFAEML